MAQYDPETGKLRATWTVRFTPWQTLLGSAVAGVVCGLVLVFQFVTGPGISELSNTANVAQGIILVVGICLGVFLVIGPTLAWGLGFMLRNVKNQNWHVIAFGVLGVFVGLSFGGFLAPVFGIDGFETVLAPAMGIGSAIGRWVLSPYAKV